MEKVNTIEEKTEYNGAIAFTLDVQVLLLEGFDERIC